MPEDNWVLAPTYEVDIHLPEYWAYVQFADTNVNGTEAVRDPDWTIRFLAMQVYYAELAHEKKHGAYTDNMDVVASLTPIPNALTRNCTGSIHVQLHQSGRHYTAFVRSLNSTRTASVRDDRYLIVT